MSHVASDELSAVYRAFFHRMRTAGVLQIDGYDAKTQVVCFARERKHRKQTSSSAWRVYKPQHRIMGIGVSTGLFPQSTHREHQLLLQLEAWTINEVGLLVTVNALHPRKNIVT